MDLGRLVNRLDDRLGIEAYRTVDASANGLQIGQRSKPVDHVALAVDAAVEPANRASDADVLVVHHGLIWGDGLGDVTGLRFERFKPFFDHDLALYAVHLPLDGHPELGHAAQLTTAMGLVDAEPFGMMGDVPTGVIADADDDLTSAALRRRFADAVGVEAAAIGQLGPTPDRIDRVATVTGSGTDFIEDAAAAGADALLTGEPKHSAYHRAQDLDLSVLHAGHYATETIGLKALGDLIAEWGLETTFIDVPTGL